MSDSAGRRPRGRPAGVQVWACGGLPAPSSDRAGLPSEPFFPPTPLGLVAASRLPFQEGGRGISGPFVVQHSPGTRVCQTRTQTGRTHRRAHAPHNVLAHSRAHTCTYTRACTRLQPRASEGRGAESTGAKWRRRAGAVRLLPPRCPCADGASSSVCPAGLWDPPRQGLSLAKPGTQWEPVASVE